ncbi:MAG: hypothetical protein IIB57_01525 [Planctomycetes bacterium]|nr:hypothetical protein [Planctomycetota bacterium]
MSDGGFNEGAPVAETARYAADRALPVYVVGIGDPTVPKNVRVVEVMAPDNAFVGDPIAITAQLVTQGVSGQSIKVELHERLVSGGAPGRVVDTRDVVPAAGGAVEPITFRRRQGTVGRYVYTVQVSALSGETILEDNSRQKTVNIIEARTKVLLIAGGPSWEYRFVSRLLQRDDSFDLSCWLQSADVRAVRDGNTVIDHLPFLPEELFAYDVIILMDPDKAEFDESWCRLADTFVSEYGGGLLLAAARARTPGFLREPRFKPLHDLLPVTFDLDVDLVLNTIGHYQLRGSPVEIPPQAVGHPVMRQADDAVSTRLIWNKVAEVFWHYPVLREKPAATVLMRHGNSRMRNSFGGHVIAAVQYVGAGRTAFLGIDGTWRWRRYGDALFNRFWVQMIRMLGRESLVTSNQAAVLDVNPRRIEVGQPVRIDLRLLDGELSDDRRISVSIVIQDEDGQPRAEIELRRVNDSQDRYSAVYLPDFPGLLQVRLDDLSLASLQLMAQVDVIAPDDELRRPETDHDLLETLSETTGGRMLYPDELGELANLLPNRSVRTINPLSERIWDTPLAFALFMMILMLEWIGRKALRLV